MIKNIGNTDRNIRLIVAALLSMLYLTGQLTGPAAVIILVIAALLVLTAIVRICPGYLLLKINTFLKRQR